MDLTASDSDDEVLITGASGPTRPLAGNAAVVGGRSASASAPLLRSVHTVQLPPRHLSIMCTFSSLYTGLDHPPCLFGDVCGNIRKHCSVNTKNCTSTDRVMLWCADMVCR